MVRRTSAETAVIGTRIKDRRQQLGWSIRHAASLADLSHTTWSRIERGELSADNRFTIAAIAQALKCPVSALTRLPVDISDKEEAATSSAVYETMRAVVEADLHYEPTTPAPPLTALQRELDLVRDLRAKCDYRGAAERLPNLLRGLHAAAHHDENRTTALRALTIAEDTASFVVRYAGHPTSACLAADRAQQAAEALNHPVMLGLAAWSRAHAATGCGLYDRALTIAEHAAQELEPHIKKPEAPEMLGQLLMTQAFSLYALCRIDAAAARVAEAQQIAALTGDSPVLYLMFGPTNISFWQIGMEADGPDPSKAVDIARTTSAQAIPNVSRQAAFYIDTARALTRIGKDQEALRMLLTAERVAPQRMRSELVIETVRAIRDRARRRSGWNELQGLAERIGLGM